ncbi:MAG: bifunctional aspartate kinase/diaminopimelate decarboxylase [Myxococcota bacterium]
MGAHRRLDLSERGPVDHLLDQLGRLLEGIRLTQEVSPRLEARVMSFGELASTHLGRAALARRGLPVLRLDAREVLTTRERPEDALESRHLEAEVIPRRAPEAVESIVGEAECLITQGFIARSPGGATCLLGRGGSDTSGTLFGALLGAERVEIWTDVHGMFTADPRQIPAARLVRQIGYREAQELSAMGAKVLHPRAIGPARWANIPIAIRNTRAPDGDGTLISPHREEASSAPAVMAVVKRTGVTLLSIETLNMWGTHGFLARVFQPFMELGISVDLVATSQAAVTVTLDRLPGGVDGERFHELVRRLGDLGEVKVVHPTAVVSIVGRKIRTVLHELGPAFQVFREHAIHLVSESSEDLNFSFVVDEDDADKLVASLHARLVPAQGAEGLFGPTWARLMDEERPITQSLGPRWWREERERLLEAGAPGQPRFVYHLPTVEARARALKEGLPTLAKLFYAMKANPHPALLRTIRDAGFGIECVSAGEMAHVRTHLGPEAPILFTPNFCPVDEYGLAFDAGAEVTLDGPHLLLEAPQIFRNREVALRVDPGEGLGHHEKVRTAGAHAKFGLPLSEAAKVREAADAVGAKVVGLHAHVGSGILDPEAWSRTGRILATLEELFPDLQWINVGGGLGVVERPGQAPLDLGRVEASLAQLKGSLRKPVELRMEPGRYLVSEAGVLLTPVTQVRSKGDVRFIGSATGMNSLLRPALYGAWHGIHNLTRLESPPTGYAHIVGPICESSDVLGRDRLLPETEPGDLLLIENCGAYGSVMSSSYNLRPPAEELVLGAAPGA